MLITFQEVSPSFPPGIKLTGVECSGQGNQEDTVFTAKMIIIRPRLLSLFGKDQEYNFRCMAYDGTINGSINIRRDVKKSAYNLSAEFKDLHINEKSQLPGFLKGAIEGTLEGTIKYSGSNLFDPDATGETSLTLSNGSFKFNINILEMKDISFEEVQFKADLKNQSLNISEISLKGDDFSGRVSGIINLKNPLKKSRINISGDIEPTAAFLQGSGDADGAALLIKQSLKNGKLPFTVKDTIEKPRFRPN